MIRLLGAFWAGLALSLAPATQAGESADVIFRKVAPSVVTLIALDDKGRESGQGSGVALGKGEFVTNCHVVRDAASIRIVQGKVTAEGKFALRDPNRDLCLVISDTLDAAPVRMRSVTSLGIGEAVFAVGNPLGLGVSVSDGLVSALPEQGGERGVVTTAPLSPGSSGGGLFDAEGKLVGITTAIITFGQSINLALPTDWIEELKTRGLPPEPLPALPPEPRWFDEAQALSHNDQAEALEGFSRRWQQAQPTSAPAASFLGEALRRQNKLREAEEALQQALRLDPSYPEAWLELVYVLDALGRPHEADKALEQARLARPWAPAPHSVRALRLLRAAKPDEALREIDDALRRQPGNASYWRLRGNIFSAMGKQTQANQDFRTALRLAAAATQNSASQPGGRDGPGLAMTWVALGMGELRASRLANAEYAFRKATDLAPDRPDGWSGLGTVLGDLNRNEEALAAHDRAVRIQPVLPEARVNRANFRIKQGHRAEGLEELRKVMAQHPECANAWRSWAVHHAAVKQYPEVAPALEKLVALGQANPDDRALLAEALGTLGRGKEAETLFEEILRTAPGNAKILLALGGQLGRRGDLARAQTYIDRAIAADGSSAAAWSSKGYLQLKQGDAVGACRSLETAVRLDPANGNAWINLGEASLRAKNNGRSIQALLTATGLLPDALDARIFLAQAYLASLQPEKAREQATAILMRHRHNTAAEGINTLAYLMEGNSPKAREAYDRVRGENPQAARQLKSLAISSGQAGARDLPD